jgi:hypothetical protein
LLNFDRSAGATTDCAYAGGAAPASARALWRAAGTAPRSASSAARGLFPGSATRARSPAPPMPRTVRARDAGNGGWPACRAVNPKPAADVDASIGSVCAQRKISSAPPRGMRPSCNHRGKHEYPAGQFYSRSMEQKFFRVVPMSSKKRLVRAFVRWLAFRFIASMSAAPA